MATYSNIGIKLITTGDESGTWGDTTNTNFSDILDEAIAGAVTYNIASDADVTLTVSDGSSSDARHAVIRFTSTTLSATRTVTFAPDTLQKTWLVINATTGGQSLTFKQGSAGATVTVPNGESAIIYSDGAGATNGAITKALDSFTNTKITTGTLNATTLDLTNLEVTNVKAKDGTAALTIADSTGKVTVSSELAVDNLNLSGNAITSTNSNGNIDLTPDGTGEVNITKVDIDGGTIDGTTIGGGTPAAGTFTTATATTGNITTVNATTVDATNVEVTNVKAKDGTAAITIADSTGAVTVGAGATINGGAVFNETGADVDFRIESDTNANAFVLDGATGNVGIGAAPTTALSIVRNTGSGTLSVLPYLDIKNELTVANPFSLAGINIKESVANVDFSLLVTGTSLFGGPGVLLRTVSAHPLLFRTNDTERMRIDSSGNVGIGGTAAASSKVNALGTYPSSGTVTSVFLADGTIPSASTGTASIFRSGPTTEAASFSLSTLNHYVATASAFGAGSTVGSQFGFVAGSALTGATNNYGFYSNIASGSGRYNFYAAGTATNYFEGDVGIGTTSPLAKLSVSGSPSGGLGEQFRINSSTAAAKMTLVGTGSGNNAGFAVSSGNLIFYNATANTERMRIDASGNVGIGTSSPGAKLDVRGSAVFNEDGADVDFRIESDTNANAFVLDGANGNIGIGDAASLVGKLFIGGSLPNSGGFGYGFYSAPTVPNGLTTSARMFYSLSSTAAASFTLTDLAHYMVGQGTFGAGSAVTNQYGFIVTPSMTGATNNYGFYSNIASGSNRWNFYANGTAANYFAGNTGVGLAPAAGVRLHCRGVDATSGNFVFSAEDSGGNALMYVRNDGLINTGTQTNSPYNNTTANAANVVLDAGGSLQRSTSSLRYKSDVADATHGLADVLKLRSVTYKGKNDGDKVFGGLIAEEVHDAGLTEFVAYDKEGRPDALHYGNMVALLVKAVQELKAELDTLKGNV